MKLSQIRNILRLRKIGAIRQSSLMSAINNMVSQANIPGALAVAVETSRKIVTETLPQATVKGAKLVAANPGTAATCGVAGVGLVLVATPAAVAASGLGLVGFGSNGVIAGSSAATIQSGIGSVVSPSLFATLQSAGAGGYGAAAVYPVVQAVGGAISSSAAGSIAWLKSKSRSKA